ncbi:MAG: hypothetical protein WAP23_00770 [Candidatus Spechtbacterales bacterium]
MTGKRMNILVLGLLVVLVSAFALACGTNKAADQEKFDQQFDGRYDAGKDKRKAEFSEWYNSIESEKRAELARLTEEINAKVLASARPVSVDLAFMTTLKQLFLDTEVDIRINAKRAEAQLEPLTIDEIYTDFQEEGISEIPQPVKTVMEIFTDGNVGVHLSSFLTSGQMNLGWFMGQSFVGVPPQAYFEICNSVPVAEADEFRATFTMRADIGSEDAWKEEVLFSGTVRHLCSNEDSYPKFYEEQGIVIFKRPSIKLLPVPAESAIVLGSVDELEEGDKLYYPRITEDGIKVEIGFFEGVKKFNPNVEIIEFRGALNPSIDAGAPVYYISADKNLPVRLVGFVTQDESISAVSAEFVLTGVLEAELVAIKD